MPPTQALKWKFRKLLPSAETSITPLRLPVGKSQGTGAPQNEEWGREGRGENSRGAAIVFVCPAAPREHRWLGGLTGAHFPTFLEPGS